MYPPLPASETAVFFGASAVSAGAALRVLLPSWWRAPAVRRALFAVIGAGILGFALWCIAPLFGAWGLSSQGVGLTWLSLFMLASFAASLPIAAVVRGLFVLVGRVEKRWRAPRRSAPPSRAPEGTPPAPKLARRALLEGAAAAAPLVAVSQSLRGFAGANDEQRLPVVRMRYADLPRELHGLRILHLSDLHLGVSFGVEDLENLLDRARPLAPHLVVLTGDLADDVRQIAPALRALDQFRAPLGAFASLGNHEYLHDIRRTRPEFTKSPVPLLVDGGTTIRVGAARLYLGGADDPVVLAGTEGFLRRSVERCARDAPRDAFRLLLSHRPEGFEPASDAGFHLTLSGHTHGGQIGLAGKSIFERLERPAWMKYAWGSYARDAGAQLMSSVRSSEPARVPSRLYTTSGFGHWFPFRLACPTEVPLVVLERA